MAETDDYADRRNFPRIPKEAFIEVAKLAYPLTNITEQQAALRNITPGGICCIVPVAYEVGTVLSLKVALKGWNQHRKGVRTIVDTAAAKAPLTAIGEVMWCKAEADNNYEIGVRLANVYEDDHKALIRYLETLLEDTNIKP